MPDIKASSEIHVDTWAKFPTDDDVERLADCLASIYKYTYYLGPLPSEGHRETARVVLEAIRDAEGQLTLGPGLHTMGTSHPKGDAPSGGCG